MKISTKGRYALRVMVYLAINNKDNYIKIKDIAKDEEISKKYLEQIMTLLVKTNLIETNRGNIGGYKLVKKPNQYKVGEILQASEGNLEPFNCLSNACNRKSKCLTYSFWQGLNNVINDYVNSVTLEDLIR